jgi:predicted nucleic-acid-binding protein
MDKGKDKKYQYKKVLAFLRKHKPNEQKVLNALKFFNKSKPQSSFAVVKSSWSYFCAETMFVLKHSEKYKGKSDSFIANAYVKQKDYIKFRKQFGVPETDLKKKARNFLDCYRKHKAELELRLKK